MIACRTETTKSCRSIYQEETSVIPEDLHCLLFCPDFNHLRKFTVSPLLHIQTQTCPSAIKEAVLKCARAHMHSHALTGAHNFAVILDIIRLCGRNFPKRRSSWNFEAQTQKKVSVRKGGSRKDNIVVVLHSLPPCCLLLSLCERSEEVFEDWLKPKTNVQSQVQIFKSEDRVLLPAFSTFHFIPFRVTVLLEPFPVIIGFT